MVCGVKPLADWLRTFATVSESAKTAANVKASANASVGGGKNNAAATSLSTTPSGSMTGELSVEDCATLIGELATVLGLMVSNDEKQRVDVQSTSEGQGNNNVAELLIDLPSTLHLLQDLHIDNNTFL